MERHPRRGDKSPTLRKIRPLKRSGRMKQVKLTQKPERTRRSEVQGGTQIGAQHRSRNASFNSRRKFGKRSGTPGSGDARVCTSPTSPCISLSPEALSGKQLQRANRGRYRLWPVTATKAQPWDCQRNRGSEASCGHPTRGRLKPTLPKQSERNRFKESHVAGTGSKAALNLPNITN